VVGPVDRDGRQRDGETLSSGRPGRLVLMNVTFEEYVQQRGRALVRLAGLLVGHRQLAEDLVQEVLARAYAQWSRVARADNPDLYLRRMLVNAYTSWWRRRSYHETVGAPVRETAAPGALDVQIAERDALWQLILTLPKRQRAAVVLRYYEDLDDVVIAEILDCSRVTVRTHIRRALATLRQRLVEQPATATVRSHR
jgi:RNA polymerase sigma-70 factor (sigma-E family)